MLSVDVPELYFARSFSRSLSVSRPFLGLAFTAPLVALWWCLSLALRVFFSGEGEGAGDDFAFSFGALFGVRGDSSCGGGGGGGGAARAPGGRLNGGRVSALAVDSRRGFGMQVVLENLHIKVNALRITSSRVCSYATSWVQRRVPRSLGSLVLVLFLGIDVYRLIGRWALTRQPDNFHHMGVDTVPFTILLTMVTTNPTIYLQLANSVA